MEKVVGAVFAKEETLRQLAVWFKTYPQSCEADAKAEDGRFQKCLTDHSTMIEKLLAVKTGVIDAKFQELSQQLVATIDGKLATIDGKLVSGKVIEDLTKTNGDINSFLSTLNGRLLAIETKLGK